jgi:chemotaxis protein methyltransferase CheR/type IV pilus assembly protein PilK
MASIANFPSIAEKDMPQWESWIESVTGILLRGRKRVLEQGIYPRLLACGVSTLEEYQHLVDFSVEGQAEKLALIDQLTVKDSSFFRSEKSMTAVGEYLRRSAREIGSEDYELRMWSVGCALGQEAYSLAMIASEQFAYTGQKWGVLATDISPSAVIYAAAGHYADKQVRTVSAHRKRHFFDRDENGWRVGKTLRNKIRFGNSNLKNIETCPYGDLDIIYCQNVLIYFREELVNSIVSELVTRLRPGGILVLGAGEAPGWKSSEVTRWRPEILNAYRVR